MAERSGLPRFRFALGEFFIIVAGVLVALLVDEGRSDLQDRNLELQYASRLKLDLERDTARFAEFERGALQAKADVLSGLLAVLEGAEDLNVESGPLAQMDHLHQSQFVALPEAQSAVFREMESTGTLRLLSEPSLRTDLADHYAEHDLLAGILAESTGQYREIFASAFPADAQFRWLTEGIEPDSQEIAGGIRDLLAHPGFREAVNAELAYCGALIFWLRQSRDRADAILQKLNGLYPQ